MKKVICTVLLFALTFSMLISCDINIATKIEITDGNSVNMRVGEEKKLSYSADGMLMSAATFKASNAHVSVSSDGVVRAQSAGMAIVTLTAGELFDTIVIIVSDEVESPTDEKPDSKPDSNPDSKPDSTSDPDPTPSPEPEPDPDPTPSPEPEPDPNPTPSPEPDPDPTPSPEPEPEPDEDIPDDKYIGMSSEEFYASYTPAVNLEDALLRSAEGFMSGSITVSAALPDISDYQPLYLGMLVRNTAAFYSDGGQTYTVVDAYGEVVMKIYRGGGYITLEEVAAYVYAFGDIPANYDPNKNNKTVASGDRAEWGIYVRLNNSAFSGDTSRYPDEPELPNISGCGGSYTYREIDIGTASYNNGTKITRGTCRIVYAYSEGSRLLSSDERYVFYTSNHYSDFREYLNYYGGWGEIFGDETGGGTPTDYPSVYRTDITYLSDAAGIIVTEVAFVFEKRFASAA